MPEVRIPAFAKINLRLEILGKRPDGFHELRTIFQTISLHDTLELKLVRSPRRKAVTLETDEPRLPLGAENLVFRALEAMRSELGLRQGVHARLEKRIPIARGLGGGSADAASALVGMLRLTGRKIPLPRLMALAAGLGADVPFFLFGGRAVAAARGDEIYPLPDAPARTLLIISPRGIGVSTREAYGWLSQELTNAPRAPNIWEFCALCWSRSGPLSNDFEGPVFGRYPRLGEIRAELLKQGAADAALAGSGSAVFGIFQNPAQARRAARAFPEDSAFVVKTLSREHYGRALAWRVAS